MFRDDHPLAWSYHRGTSRWPFNMHGLNTPAGETPQFKENIDADSNTASVMSSAYSPSA